MKSILNCALLSLFLFTAKLANSNNLPKIKVEGKDIVAESGKVIRLKGVSFSDPDKLEKNEQWNKRYFHEAKNWGCNVVRFAIHPTALYSRGWNAYFEMVDKGINWATEL